MDFVLIDTSAYFAIIDKSDKNHRLATNFLREAAFPFVTTSLVVIETVNLVNSRIGHTQAIAIGRTLYDRDITTVVGIAPEDEKRPGRYSSATRTRISR